jgi:hypothetical protein
MNEAGLYEFDISEHVHYVSSLRTIHEFLTRWAHKAESLQPVSALQGRKVLVFLQ